MDKHPSVFPQQVVEIDLSVVSVAKIKKQYGLKKWWPEKDMKVTLAIRAIRIRFSRRFRLLI